MNVLVTGGSSLLGLNLHRTVPEGVDARFTWWTTWQPWCAHQMNVADPSMVSHVVNRVRPEVVIHMAAEGNVDVCEANYGVAELANVQGTRNVRDAVSDHGARLVLTSSNAVYDGERAPYAPDSIREPVNAYGRLRRRAEESVRGYSHEWSIVRLMMLYGWEPEGARANWGSNAVRALEAGKKLRVVDDVIYQPTWAQDAARAVWRVALDLSPGEFNVAGEKAGSLFDFVQEIVKVFNFCPALVEPASIRDFPNLAPRPRDSTYDLEKSKTFGLSCRGIQEGLEAMYEDWVAGYRGGPEGGTR